MRFFKKPWFQRFAEKEGISDAALKTMVKEIEKGKMNANLGGYVYKQRLAKDDGGNLVAIGYWFSFAEKIALFVHLRSPSQTETTSRNVKWSS